MGLCGSKSNRKELEILILVYSVLMFYFADGTYFIYYISMVFQFCHVDGTYFSFVVLMERIFRNIYMSGCCVPYETKPWVLVLLNLYSIRSDRNHVLDIILDTTREYSSQVLKIFIVLQVGT